MTITKCPECGCPINGEKVCPECGYPISDTKLREQLVPCCDCGHMVSTDAKECPQCGGHLSEKSARGKLRIIMQGKGKKDTKTAPLYINGQLIEAVSLSRGCDISIPINNPNMTIGYEAPRLYVEHTYHFDSNCDYNLVITNGANLGFTLFDDYENKISSDKLNGLWVIFSILFGVFAIIISYIECNSKPIFSKSLRYYGLLVLSIPLFGLPIAIAMGDCSKSNRR